MDILASAPARRASSREPRSFRAAHRRSRRFAALAAAIGLCLAALPDHPARAGTGGALPVPAVTLYPGDAITTEVLVDKHFYFDPGRPLPVIADAAELIGKVARRTLVAGKPIPHHGVGEPELVSRGRPAEARFRRGGLLLTTTVLPLADGGLGDMVQARNVDTGRVIEGIVVGAGAIAVSPSGADLAGLARR